MTTTKTKPHTGSNVLRFDSTKAAQMSTLHCRTGVQASLEVTTNRTGSDVGPRNSLSRAPEESPWTATRPQGPGTLQGEKHLENNQRLRLLEEKGLVEGRARDWGGSLQQLGTAPCSIAPRDPRPKGHPKSPSRSKLTDRGLSQWGEWLLPQP